MVASKKDRTHSGRVTIYFDDEDYPYLETFHDEWNSYRDEFRNKENMIKNIYPRISWYNDELYLKLIRNRNKLKKKEKIRQIRKEEKREEFIKRKELILTR